MSLLNEVGHLRLLRCLLPGILIAFCATANAKENQCGERIKVKDVQVVDLEALVDQQALFHEKLHEQVGDSILLTQAPVRVKWTGSTVSTINSAKKSAAHNGCDLLVLLGYSVTETRWEGTVTKNRSLMVHLGRKENPGSE